MKRYGRLAWVAAIVVVALAVLYALRLPLLRGAAGFAGGLAGGYGVNFSDVHFGNGRVTLVKPAITFRGEPLFGADSVAIAFRARDLFGSPHPFGVSAIEFDRPLVTIVHHADGTYNFVLPGNNAARTSGALPAIHLRVRDGTLGVRDDTRIFQHSRRLALEGVAADAALDPVAVSLVSFHFSVLEAGGPFPIMGQGRLDPQRGYEFTRIGARTLALAPLLDYVLNSRVLHIANGVLNDIDIELYGLRDRSGTMQRHLSGSANLDHFQPYLNSLAKPLRDGRGALRFYDGGIAIPKVDGSIAAVPVRIAGTIYDFSKPMLRLGIVGRGDLRKLIQLSDSARKLPLAGPLTFQLLVEGDAAQPLTLGSFAARRLTYGRYALDRPHGLVALRGTETDVLRSALAYGGITASLRGTIVEERHRISDLAGSFSAPAALLPYAAQVVPGMQLTGTAVVKGVDAALATTAVLGGDTAAQHLVSTLAIAGNGVGTLGPLVLEGPGGSTLYARASLDRKHNAGTGYIWARGFRLIAAPRVAELPGLPYLAPLPVDGTVDADFAATLAGKTYGASGNLHLYATRYRGVPLGDLSAAGTLAPGFEGAMRARYRGSIAQLARLSTQPITASGEVDVPFTVIASSPGQIVAQTQGGRFTNVRVNGISLDALSGTVRIRAHSVDVYAARAQIDGRDVVAQGSFGDGGVLDVSTGDFDLAGVRGLRSPLQGGRVAAFAQITGTFKAPLVDAGVLLAGASFKDMPVNGSTSLSLAGDNLRVSDATISVGPAIARLDGNVAGVRTHPKTASYDATVHVHSADIATLARFVHLPLKHPAGTLNADLAVSGAGSNSRVAGTISVPEGSVNGLPFRNATLALARTPTALEARNGRMTVGTSTLDFSAGLAGSERSFALNAPRLNLADFDDYFDTGDLLGGRGSVTLAVRASENAVAATGQAAIDDARYHRFALGSVRTTIDTQGRTIQTRASVGGGKPGTVTFAGIFNLAPVAPLRDALHRTSIALQADATAVDLGTWLPAAGIQAPIFGFAGAHLQANGTYPALRSTLHADVTAGRYANVPVQQLSADITAAGGRATITSAVLTIPHFTANASGSVGLRPNDTVAVKVHAVSGDVGAFGTTLTGKKATIAGAADDLLALGGTLRRLTFADALNVTNVTYNGYTLPRVAADFTYDRAKLNLRDAEVDTQSGRILAAGTIPIVEKPALGVGPGNGPIAFRLTSERLDLAQFAQLLPPDERAKTHVAGLIDGTVGVVGTVDRPALDGTLALSNFSYVGAKGRPALTSGNAQVTFAGTSARLHDAQIGAGAGTIGLTGLASVPSLRQPGRDLTFDIEARANHAQLNIPNYLSGTIDGTATIARTTIGATALLSGDLTFTNTRVPLQLLLPSSASAGVTPNVPPLALDLAVTVGRDVRVQSGQVDLGATGRIVAGGTLAAPTLAGLLTSTGGTISFYRTFSVDQESTVSFDPSDGIIPYVDAYATTSLESPPTDVDLHVTGLATKLNVALESNPPYSRDQIVGLLAGLQQFGAVQGIGATTQQNANASNVAESIAGNELGTVFQRQLLEPLGSEIGGAVGLQNLALDFSPGGGFDINARKTLFKNVDAVFAESFSYPQRESLGIRLIPNDATAAQLTFFSQGGSGQFSNAPTSLTSTAPAVTDSEPANGTSGFAFSLQRKYP